MRYVIEYFDEDGMDGKLTYRLASKARQVVEDLSFAVGMQSIDLWKFYPDDSDKDAELIMSWKKYSK